MTKENKNVLCGRHKHRVALFCGDCLEEIRRDFDLTERQRDAALEALEILGQFHLNRFSLGDELNERTNFAARELERIRGMK